VNKPEKMQTVTDFLKQKRLLLIQILFTLLAFAAMAVFSYIFVSNIVYENLDRYSEAVFASAQTQVENDLTDSKNALGDFALAARSIILNGADIDIIRYLVYDMTDHFHMRRAELFGYEDMVEDLFIYLEAFPGDPVVISGFGWVFPDDADPKERLWFKDAMAAEGKVAMTAPFNSLRSGDLVITFSQAIFDDSGKLLGIAGLNIHINEIGQNILNTAMEYNGYGMLISQDLTIISHANHDFIGKHIGDPALPMTAFADDLIAGKDISDDTFTNWLGEETMIHIRRLPNGWYLGLLTPRGPFYQVIDDMMFFLGVLGFVLAAILIIILIQIDKAKDRAREESTQKSAFLANMSHEIRTPLNAVIGLSELVLEADRWDEENKYKLEQINNAGRTLLSTVNDILDISKIESGKFELVPIMYDIPSVLNDASTQSLMHMGEKPIDFVMNISETLPTQLYGDELRIKQILNNLLSNALKYTREGTVELTVSSIKDGDVVWLTFIVRDTGIGIRQENMAILFNDYAQMDMAANRKIVGTGLGLSIAKRLAELMNGEITAESEYGKGSTFTVKLMQKHVTDEIIGAKVVESLKSFHYSEEKRKDFGITKRLRLPYARVLIVDDVITNLDVAQGLMKPYQMQIDCVTSGWEAVEAIYNENVHYNAVFMDHMMPGIDGIEATRLIREIGTDYAKNVPIIALTANAIVGNEEIFLNKGFQAFVSKPIEIGRLDAVIREWVRDKEQEKLYIRQDTEDEGETDMNDDTEILKHGADIYGLNIEKGLKRFNGDKEIYLSVLRSFAKNSVPLLEKMKTIYSDIDAAAEYETIVHGIKGSGGAICAEKVSEFASRLEDAAKSGDRDFISANNNSFIETATKLIEDIMDLFKKLNSEKTSEPEIKEKPDQELLETLKTACMNYDMNGVDKTISKLEVFDYKTDNDLILWLRENAEQTNFDEIVEKLTKYLSNNA